MIRAMALGEVRLADWLRVFLREIQMCLVLGAILGSVSAWLKGSSAKNVFLGCPPHVPGSWWTTAHRSPVTELHSLGFLDCVVASHGILARKFDDPRLFLLGFTTLA